MATLRLEHIAKILGNQESLIESPLMIEALLLDSRKYHNNPNTLFFALSGENHDGHVFIKELYDKGLNNFVVERLPKEPMPGANFIKVDNSLLALQQLAAYIRQNLLSEVIGITGSNGKTIVKEWLFQLLHQHYKVVKSPKSYNSQIGVPLSVWQSDSSDELGLFEAGISEPGEMEKLEAILKPELGIITNIGSAHDAFFADRREKIREKLKLFIDTEKLIYCADHKELNSEIQSNPQIKDVKKIRWSRLDSNVDLYVSSCLITGTETEIRAIYNNEEMGITIPFIDQSSIENALHCWLCCLELNIPTSALKESFSRLQAVEMRLEMKSGSNGTIIVNDSYNSDLESLTVALDFLNQQAQARGKILILSDILQSGLDSNILYQQVKELIDRFDLQTLIGIGDNIKSSWLKKDDGVHLFSNTDEFLDNVNKFNWENKAVLLKGARSFHFEKISRKLELKSHETVLEIHLSSLVDNLNYYRSKIQEGVKIMAMVKAFSYGSGSYEIASLLEFHKVDYLAVAYTDEGVELRKAGVSLPIMVLNAEPSSLSDIIEYDLEPEIYSFRMLNIFLNLLQQKGVEKGFPVHIKLDTGMRRLGFQEHDLSQLGDVLKKAGSIRVASAFSHLAASDDLSKKDFTEKQIDLFKEMSNELRSILNKEFDCHILNSSGITNFPQAQFTMVRLGIGLYGISSNELERKSLQPLGTLKATVSQIKKLMPGESVGYGLSFVAKTEMTIATITLGYADGLRRSLSNGIGRVWINGTFYPVVGKICMDMTMVDISNSKVQEGDEVEVIGSHVSIYEIAEKMDTIPYEVLTGISQRVKRVYYLE